MKNLLIGMLVCAVSLTAFSQTQNISPSNQHIRYVGRFDFSNPEEVHFDWSGVYIQFSFKGTDCALKMNDKGHDYYNVFVDDLASQTFDVKSDTVLFIARSLPQGEHRIQIYKRTEATQGHGIFKGILISEKGEMLAWKDIPERKIEFIGNSITCGYGTEGLSKSERFKASTENNYLSYAAVLARAFKADYHITAHSGMGVVRNYNYKEKTSPIAMPDHFKRLFDLKEQPLWNFDLWKPDIVVINLGTNDFSTNIHPDKEVFIAGYKKLIGDVFSHYGELPVFCLVGPMSNEPCYSYVKEMVESLRNSESRKNVYFIGIPTYLLHSDNDYGSDHHPNYSGQKKMAAFVLPVMANVLGWDCTKKEFE